MLPLQMCFSILLGGLCLCAHPLISAGTLSTEEEKAIQQQFIDLQARPGAAAFSPPTGWHLTDPKALPNSVKVMVVGKGAHTYPPSMNLSTEKYSGTLKSYLRQVKSINESQGDEWKDLGTIRTEAGEASLSQVDIKNEWGKVRMMHVILLRNGIVNVLTASALQEEFPQFYDTFFKALKSLRINSQEIK